MRRFARAASGQRPATTSTSFFGAACQAMTPVSTMRASFAASSERHLAITTAREAWRQGYQAASGSPDLGHLQAAILASLSGDLTTEDSMITAPPLPSRAARCAFPAESCKLFLSKKIGKWNLQSMAGQCHLATFSCPDGEAERPGVQKKSRHCGHRDATSPRAIPATGGADSACRHQIRVRRSHFPRLGFTTASAP